MASKTIMNTGAFHKKGFLISTEKKLLDQAMIFHFIHDQSYWGKDLTMLILEKSIMNSLCFGVYQHEQQIGFARVITDHATFAYLADVFILPAHRKQGLSKWLVQTILEHPHLNGLRRWLLSTADAHGLYAQMGFEPIKKPKTFMEIVTPHRPPAIAKEPEP